MAIHLPLEQPIILPPDPDDSAQQVAAALTAFQAGQSTASAYRAQLNAIAARSPTCLNAWAALGSWRCPTMSSPPMPIFGSAITGGSTGPAALAGAARSNYAGRTRTIVAFCAASTV